MTCSVFGGTLVNPYTTPGGSADFCVTNNTLSVLDRDVAEGQILTFGQSRRFGQAPERSAECCVLG